MVKVERRHCGLKRAASKPDGYTGGKLAWPATRPPNSLEVESVTERRRTDEGQPVQGGANYRDLAGGGGGGKDAGGVSSARDLGRDLLQVEGEVRRARDLRGGPAEVAGGRESTAEEAV